MSTDHGITAHDITGHGIAQRIDAALRAATAAPSLFNSQPWRVSTTGSAVLICTDRTRRVPVHDPHDRELLIACGAFTLYAQIALEGAGLHCDVEHLPGTASVPDVVAALHVRPHCPGDISDDRAQTLASVMDRTLYDRRPFVDHGIDEGTLTTLRRAVEAEGAWLVVLEDDRRIEAAVLHTHADDLLRADPAAEAEVKVWTRYEHSYDDGVSVDSVEGHSDERGCSFRLRDFNSGPARAGSAHRPPEPERPTLALLCTPHDTAADAVATGRALGRLLLEAAAAGVTTSPLNQALQSPTRWRLVRALSLTGTPQYQLRMGMPRSAPLEPHRRRLEQLRRAAGNLGPDPNRTLETSTGSTALKEHA